MWYVQTQQSICGGVRKHSSRDPCCRALCSLVVTIPSFPSRIMDMVATCCHYQDPMYNTSAKHPFPSCRNSMFENSHLRHTQPSRMRSPQTGKHKCRCRRTRLRPHHQLLAAPTVESVFVVATLENLPRALQSTP